MSSQSPSSPPVASQSSKSDDGHPPGSSNNLYLVTFLATLFLLLFVSCAIVLRSYIFRRRYQRRLEEAMAAGMLLAPRAQGSKRKRFGSKPKMFDAWLTDGGEIWDEMTPLAAQSVFVKRKYKEGTGPKAAGDGQLSPGFVEIMPNAPPPRPTAPLHSGVRTLLQRFRRQPDPPTPTLEPDGVDLEGAGTSAPTTTTTAPGSYKVRVEMLQVSVLVAMPSPTRRRRKNRIADSKQSFDDIEEDGEEPLPDIAFGITRVNYRQPKISTTPLGTPVGTPATAAQTPAEPQANYGSYF
ncbi:hypothetical protein CPB83DRAFT_890380 [Crepidotus variabilis]|uniref:Uncharacterized protein n=1 Tax=Crepidotus variabilis TaxID=179855 RepID=A0A9P6JTL7_9AGAR|nr:hypothetical protein CPB83DRAFT_890380 [Crepidotus variabilis]